MRNTMTKLAAGILWGMAILLFSGSPASAAVKPDPSGEEVYFQLKQDRKNLIKLLREYAKKGDFPFGQDDSPAISKEDPHFDPKQLQTHRILGPNGSLCALAHLVSRSGNEALVNELAKKENYFCVGKDRNSAVEKWIRTSGLTLEECIQIQEPGMIMENPPKSEKRGRQVTGEIANQERIRALLLKVAAQLEKNTEKSLKTAVKRHMKAKS